MAVSGILLAASSFYFLAGQTLAVDCPLPLTAGRGTRWPPTNPALVAPVALVYDTHVYQQPLQAELTSDSISIPVPLNFFAGFNLSDAVGVSQEAYALRSIVIRKPGRVAEGASQILSHVLEMVLLHENTAGAADAWSSVVVPFSVELGAAPDMLSALLAGSRLPSDYGERSPVLMSASQVLDLKDAYNNATFLTYWTTLPTKCTDVSRPVRQFLRTTPLVTSPMAFDTILSTLRSVPDAPPTPSADVAWLTSSCQHSKVGMDGCVVRKPTDLAAELLEAQTLQSQAVSKIRTAKSNMDAALVALKNVTDETYQAAVKARATLQSASAELDGSTAHVEALQANVMQAQSTTWQASPPSASAASTGELASASSLLASAQLNTKKADGGASNGDCSALGRSPVAIQSAEVVQAQSAWKAARTPLVFGRGALAADISAKPLQLYNTGEYLRVVAPAGSGSPLGTVKRGQHDLDVVFADVHLPGEHTIDGTAAAVEVQLVHLPRGSGPAVAVALRLQEGGEGSAYDNPWVAALLSAVPPSGSEAPLRASQEGARGMHAALARGDASRYFRYDGTLTRAPCRTAEWFVLEEPGSISSRQLAALRAALPRAPRAGAGPAARQAASLIAEGIQDFPAPSTLASVSLLGKWSAKQRNIHSL